MTKTKIAAIIAVTAIFLCGIAASNRAVLSSEEMGGTNVDVVDLYENPKNYETSDDIDAASVIIEENLEKTQAANNVAAVVFDFRGFDTLGESFILLTAIAGTFVILSRKKPAHHADEKGGEA